MNELTTHSVFTRSRLICLVVSLIAGLCIYNQVLNSYYAVGTNLFDSGFWGTLSWRNDWLLTTPPAMGDMSFFNIHISPIHWLPNAVSFLYPGSRLGFYALVYGAAFFASCIAVFRLIEPLYGRRFGAWVAGVCSLAWFLSEPIFKGMWEPHMELLSPLFAILMYQSWFKRQYWRCFIYLVLNASIREDVALFFSMPVVLSSLETWRQQRTFDAVAARETIKRAMVFFVVSVLLTGIAIFVQKKWFTQYSVVATTYYDPSNLLGHLTPRLLMDRLHVIATEHLGIWCPMVLMALAALVWRDWRLLAGAIAFAPYFMVNFLSRDPLSATLGSYKAFPFATMLLWPALLACAPEVKVRGRLALLQIAMLCAGVSYINGDEIGQIKVRFVPQPMSQNVAAYDALGRELAEHVLPGNVRSSDAVSALYPYDFGYGLMTYQPLRLDNIALDQIDTVIWIPGDRFFSDTQTLLRRNPLPYHYHLPGTLIRISTRLPLPRSLANMMEPMAGPGFTAN
jgi:hypothetical protein